MAYNPGHNENSRKGLEGALEKMVSAERFSTEGLRRELERTVTDNTPEVSPPRMAILCSAVQRRARMCNTPHGAVNPDPNHFSTEHP